MNNEPLLKVAKKIDILYRMLIDILIQLSNIVSCIITIYSMISFICKSEVVHLTQVYLFQIFDEHVDFTN